MPNIIDNYKDYCSVAHTLFNNCTDSALLLVYTEKGLCDGVVNYFTYVCKVKKEKITRWVTSERNIKYHHLMIDK